MVSDNEKKDGSGHEAAAHDANVAASQGEIFDASQDRHASFCVELGLCGLGMSRDLFPEVRLMLVRFWWCRGSAADVLRDLPKIRNALRAAREELGRKQ